MGTATNQIATEKDLYYSGFTNFASSGPSATMGVTYGDIENLKSNGFIETSYKNYTTISPNLITGEGQTFTDTYSNLPVSSDNKFYYITICEYDITRLSAYDKISILDGSDGMYNIDVRAYGTAATGYYAYTYLCIGDSHPTTLGQSTNTAKFSQTHYVSPPQNSFINFSGCIHHALGGVTDNITNFKGKNKLYWRLYIDKVGVG